jgi:23S rRNA (cytidine2498-2'-O)-methyltransferase
MNSDSTNAGVTSAWIATSNRGFSVYGLEELRRLFPLKSVTHIVPGEWYRFDADLDRKTVLARLKSREPVFVRHIHPVELIITPREQDRSGQERRDLLAFLETRRDELKGCKIALQMRKAPQTAEGVWDDIRTALTAWLEQADAVPVVRQADWIFSLTAGRESWYAGLSRPWDNLSDWPGGAVRFRKESGQLSRAKFKLLEAEYVFGLDFSQYRRALDIGAAPGGWTSLLLERGLEVTAIDPAPLDGSLMQHPKLTYLRQNASQAKLAPDDFDLLVSDMSWDPRQTAMIIAKLLPCLRSGGTAVITVKLMHKKPFQTMRSVLERLEPELVLQRAKQLFHNRAELTMFLIKR